MSKQPDPWPTLSARLAKVEAQLARLASASAFFGTGVHPNGLGGLDSDNFDPTHGFSLQGDTGDAEFNGNVEVGGTLNVTGNTIIGGTLSLPAGIIDNDALTSPVTVSTTNASATNFAVTTTPTKFAQGTLLTPAGFTTALVFCFANGNAFNSSASQDYLTVQAAVNGATGGGVNATVAAGQYGTTVTGVRTSTLTGLTTGQAVTVEAWAGTSSATWAADAINFVFVNAFAVWLR